MRLNRCPLVFAGALSLLSAGSVSAQPKGDSGEAARLFEQGRGELEAGQTEAACEHLARSDRLEPAVGTLGLLAACHELQNKLATAYRDYLGVAERAHKAGDSREAYARDRADKLKPRVPMVTLRSRGAEAGISVTCDGLQVHVGESILLDEGIHHLVVTAPGKSTWLSDIRVAAATQQEVTIPDLGQGDTKAIAPIASPPFPVDTARPETPASSGATRRTIGFVLGGIGIGALGVVGVTGAMYLSSKSTLNDPAHCDAQKRCDAEGLDAADRIRVLGPVNTVAWIVGVGALGAGLVLVATSGSGKPATSARLGAHGVSVERSF